MSTFLLNFATEITDIKNIETIYTIVLINKIMLTYMKRILIALVTMVATLTTMAADYNYLIIGLQNGTEKALTANGLTMTFADGYLKATTGNGTESFSLSTLSKMYFSETESTGISEQMMPASTLRVDGRTLQISAPAGAQVLIANANGMLIDRYTAANDAVTKGLRPGIYIVKINNQSTKIHIR